MNQNILNIFHGENIGGIEKNIEILSDNFKELGYFNFFLKLSENKIPIKLSGKYIYLYENKSNNFLLNFIKLIKRAYIIKKTCKQNNISSSISHGDTINFSNILSKVLFNNQSKIIITINNSLDHYKNVNILNKIILFMINLLYKRSDIIVCISNEMKIDIINKLKLNQDNLVCIYNPINQKQIIKLQTDKIDIHENLFNNGKKTFIHIGRLDKVKNQSFLLKIFDLFMLKNINYQFIIIGDGNERYNLIKIKESLISKENIHFLGHQNNIYKYLKKSDYFLFSSFHEGFGRSLIEAISCGIPILTHDFKYGAKEIIRNNDDFGTCNKIEIHTNGILVPYMDLNKYLEGMRQLVNHKWDKNNIINNSKKFDIGLVKEKRKDIVN